MQALTHHMLTNLNLNNKKERRKERKSEALRLRKDVGREGSFTPLVSGLAEKARRGEGAILQSQEVTNYHGLGRATQD